MFSSDLLSFVVFILFGINYILLIIFTIQNFLKSIKLFASNDISLLIKSTRKIKFQSIPFFLLNFVILYIISFILFIATRGLGIIIIPLFIAYTYIIFLSTSIYSFSLIFLLKIRYNLSIGWLLLHLFMQLSFVFDIWSVFLITGKCREIERNGGVQLKPEPKMIAFIKFASVVKILVVIGFLVYEFVSKTGYSFTMDYRISQIVTSGLTIFLINRKNKIGVLVSLFADIALSFYWVMLPFPYVFLSLFFIILTLLNSSKEYFKKN